MNEYTLQIIAIGKLLTAVIFAGLYGFGGISRKYLRRYVAPFIMGVAVWLFSLSQFKWYYLLYPLLLCLSLHLGYGATDMMTKIKKRFVYGLALAISALPLAFSSDLWLLYSLHCLLCVSSSVVLGVFNPVGNARNEETLIGALSTIVPLYLI